MSCTGGRHRASSSLLSFSFEGRLAAQPPQGASVVSDMELGWVAAQDKTVSFSADCTKQSGQADVYASFKI